MPSHRLDDADDGFTEQDYPLDPVSDDESFATDEHYDDNLIPAFEPFQLPRSPRDIQLPLDAATCTALSEAFNRQLQTVQARGEVLLGFAIREADDFDAIHVLFDQAALRRLAGADSPPLRPAHVMRHDLVDQFRARLSQGDLPLGFLTSDANGYMAKQAWDDHLRNANITEAQFHARADAALEEALHAIPGGESLHLISLTSPEAHTDLAAAVPKGRPC